MLTFSDATVYHDLTLQSADGRFVLAYAGDYRSDPVTPGLHINTYQDTRYYPSAVPLSHWLGCDAWYSHRGIEGRRLGISGPLWLPVALSTSLAATLVLVWFRQRTPIRLGQCRVCGYDLRATPDRCPECGTAVSLTQELPA
jgi:hypothetical protein